jgi:Flp pilus assembly protein TadD
MTVGLTDLANTAIAEPIRHLAAERRSGDLQVRSGRLAKTVYFDHGRIVFAASNLRKDRLGEALMALGDISDEEYNRATALMATQRRRHFGEALVRAGILDKQQIGRAVARQVRRIALSLFELHEGVASFEERVCVIPLEYMVSLSVHRLLYEGIHLIRRREPILNGLGDLDRRVTVAPTAPFNFEFRDCSAEEREMLELAKRPVSLRRLAWGAQGLELSRLRAAYALLASYVLQPTSPTERAPRPIIQMETGSFLLSSLRRRPEPSPTAALRQEIRDELERSSRLDREAWLQVSRSAPREELERALEGKMERYHALLDAVHAHEELKRDVEVILGRASAMLRMLRQADSEITVPPAGEEAPASDAERLRRQGDAQLAVGDYARAVRSFEALVEKQPRDASFRRRLATAMAGYPPTAPRAEREYVESLRLEPDNAESHYQLGLYYKTMRQRVRALAEMQTAVHLDPRHEAARHELETLSPHDPLLAATRARR